MGAPAAAAAGAAVRGGGSAGASGGAAAMQTAGGGGGGGDRQNRPSGGGGGDDGGRGRKVIAVVLGAIVGMLIMLATLVAIIVIQQQQACGPIASGGGADDSPDLTTVQIAQKIYVVGKDMGVTDKLILSAFVTGMVESGGGEQMRNLACDNPGDCDRDSVGVFQQRDMSPWNKRNRRNVSDAARSYFEVALTVDQPSASLSDVSYRTQRPDAQYAARYYDPPTIQRAAALLHQVEQGAGTLDAPDLPNAGKPSTSASPQDMIWPTAVHTIKSDFGPRDRPCDGCSTNHQGLDIAAGEGDPIHAVLQGRITTRADTSGYGNYVCITHSAQLTTCYGHLSRFAKWDVNDTVPQGTVIGYVGHTGNVTAPHLHFEVRLGPDANATAVDPAPYLDGATDATGGDDAAPDAGDTATADCASDQAGVADSADLNGAIKRTDPREMDYLPAWATADGYTSPAIHNGRAMADARIIPSLLFLLKHYNVRVHDCLASGHNTHGAGESCDIVPADDPLPRPGRMTPGWANVTQLAKDLGWQQPGPGYAGGYSCSSGAPFVPAIYIVCYNGDSNHGDPDHITGSCQCPHLHITFQSPVHGAPVELAEPPEWVMTFPLQQTADDSAPTTDAPGGSAPTVAVVGDSLGVGMKDALVDDLKGYTVRSDAEVGRTLSEGMQIARGLDAKPQVLAMSLFTNDDPSNVSALADAVRESTTLVRPGGCVVWATIARPPVGSTSYARANAKLRAIAADNANVMVVPWAEMVDSQPNLVGSDGVHSTPSGYAQRAAAYARAIKACNP